MSVCARELFARLAAELEVMHETAARIEGSLSGVGAASMRDVQRMDYLLQHLAALRNVAEYLRDVPEQQAARFDLAAAASEVTLGDVKKRLCGGVPAPRQAGDIEFF